MKPPVLVTDCVPTVTTTFTAPAACTGVTTVQAVSVQVTLLTADPPKVTLAEPAAKPTPVIITESPPNVVPEDGEILDISSW